MHKEVFEEVSSGVLLQQDVLQSETKNLDGQSLI